MIPQFVLDRILSFLAAGLTGQVVLDIKQGRVLAYKITEAGRVDRGRVEIVETMCYCAREGDSHTEPRDRR